MDNVEEALEWVRGLQLRVFRLKQAVMEIDLGLEVMEKGMERERIRALEGKGEKDKERWFQEKLKEAIAAVKAKEEQKS